MLVLMALIVAIFSQQLRAQQETAPQESPVVVPPAPAAAPEPAPSPAEPAAPVAAENPAPELAAAPAPHTLTLMVMVEQGGFILWIIMVLGFFALVWALYLLATVTVRREVPVSLSKRAQAQIRAGDIRGAYQMCQERDELLANVLRAGIKMAGHDRYVIQEAMESEGERGASELWQRISYLNNAATIAPLLGLLGTVWGMMQAFSAVAFDSAQVKGLTIAYGVSMAMITTAGGLLLAIPAVCVYYFLRGRVIKIIASVEAQASEFVELLSGAKNS